MNVLVAEDDLDLAGLIGMTLHSAGYETVRVTNGQEAVDAIAGQKFILAVIDINMPVMNGLQACKLIRERSNLPVLMLSARHHERDLLDALDAGADAYMLKPFSPRAFLARIKALLRRAAISEVTHFRAGNVHLDMESLNFRVGDAELHITKLEARLLKLLLINSDAAVSRKVLIDEVWETYSTANRNMLKQVIFRLRRKMAAIPGAADALCTVPEGYLWRTQQPGASSQAVAAQHASA